jgi:hypothetical protein
MSRLPHRFGPSARAGLALGLFAGAGIAFGSVALAQTPSGHQPVPPQPIAGAKASPVVDTLAVPRPALEIRKTAAKHAARPTRRHVVHYRHHGRPIHVERPALAGVLLVEPIPPRIAPPRPIVPTPAYFVDGLASAVTTPPPPVVCERRSPVRSLPDPRLYREVPLQCGSDID